MRVCIYRANNLNDGPGATTILLNSQGRLSETTYRSQWTPPAHPRSTRAWNKQPHLTPYANVSRTRSLLVVIGSFTSLFCTVGFLNSAGVFLEYYARDQLSSQSPSTIAWIGATAIFFLFAISPVAGAMLDAIGPKVGYQTPDRSLRRS